MQKAFSLAEILITLGIIGIVSTITLPTYISNYRKQLTTTKLKQSYWIIAQAFSLAKTEYGDTSNWGVEFISGTPTNNINRKEYLTNLAHNYILPYIKGVQDYGYISALSKFGYTGSSWNSYYFKLPNGALVETTFSNGCLKYNEGICTEGGYFDILLKIDVNGFAQPNKLGKDIFLTRFISSSGKYEMFYYKSDRTTTLNECKSTGASCGYLIQMDNWQISPDYPR